MWRYLLDCIKNFRCWVLFILLAITTVMLFIVPVDDLPTATYFYVIISSKIIAVVAGYIYYKLLKHWASKGKLPKYQ